MKLVIAFAFCLSLMAQDRVHTLHTDDHGMDLYRFEVVHYEYVRKYFGCPQNESWTNRSCKDAMQERDLELYRKARKRAAKAYNLRFPKEEKKGFKWPWSK